MKNITLYTKDNCPQCKMTKRFLNEKSINVNNEINVDMNPEFIDILKEKGFKSLPVLIEENTNFTIKGFNPTLLRQLI